MSTELDQLDKGLLQSLTGADVNPWTKSGWNLTRQLLVVDQAPDFARELQIQARNPIPQPTTRLGRPA